MTINLKQEHKHGNSSNYIHEHWGHLFSCRSFDDPEQVQTGRISDDSRLNSLCRVEVQPVFGRGLRSTIPILLQNAFITRSIISCYVFGKGDSTEKIQSS